MRLIAILLALVLHKCWPAGCKLQRYDWFDFYVERLLAKVKMAPVIQVVAVIAIPVVTFWLIVLLLRPWTYGILGLVIDSLILWYSIGTVPWRHNGNKIEATTTKEAIPAPSLIWQYQEQVYSVLCWFILLGPIGALSYRLLLETKRLCMRIEYQNLSHMIRLSQDFLDWLPVRLIGLGFTLAGNFMTSFGYWLDHLLMPLDTNKTFLTETALRTIDPSTLTGQQVEQGLVFALLERTLWILIAAVALFTIGSWLY